MCSLLITTKAKAENEFEVPLIEPQRIFQSYSFGYEDVKNYIYKKDKERKISILTSHLVKKYNLKNPYIEEIISTMYYESEIGGIDPIIFLSLIESESGFNQFAKSPVGAVGLTQVMPIYHQTKIKNIQQKDNLDMWSIKGNIKLGVKILKECIAMSNGNIEEALQRYNGSLSDKSKRYSKKILNRVKEYNSLFS